MRTLNPIVAFNAEWLRAGERGGEVFVSYDDEVTEEQIRDIDYLVREEFQSGEWVIVECE